MPKLIYSTSSLSSTQNGLIIFSIYDFLRRSRKKNKYRWFKVEGFGDGLVVVGKFQGVRCPLSGVTKGFMC